MKRLAILLLFAFPAYAQTWSGVIAPARAEAWQSNAGVTGGIPSASWTQCGSTITAGTSAATINTDLAGCAAHTYLLLGAGTFNLTTGLVMQKDVELRGSGPNSTFLVFTGNNSCGGAGGAPICFLGDSTYYGSPAVQPAGAQAASWSGSYTQGTTSITLTSVGATPPTIGQWIYLDQANSTSIGANFFVCNNTSPACSLEGGSPGRTISGTSYNEIQGVQVTNISGSTYTISPGVYAPNIAGGNSPGAWWPHVQLTDSGVTNLSVDGTNAGGASNFFFQNAFNCWMLNVRSIAGGATNHVWMFQGFHNTIQSVYFYGSPGGGPGHYGIENYISGDNLEVNNIFQQITAPFISGPAAGNVTAYNFTIGNIPSPSDYMQPSFWISHDAGSMFNLNEGNEGTATYCDVFHGTGGFNTYFRERYNGTASGITQNTSTIQLFAYCRYYNVIGGVYGTSGIQTTYGTTSGVGANGFIYNLNAGDTEGAVTVASDSLVTSTLMRWGNYDTANASVQFNNAEVPSGISPYPNSIPSSHALPASFVYTSKPSFFASSKPWPLTGPDVTGGNISGVGGFANTTPAHDCYNAMSGPPDGSGSVLAYTATACPYLNPSNAPQPIPPPNGKIIGLAAASVQVPASGSQQLTASCDTSCGSVAYSTTSGTVNASGMFIAPSVAQTVTITASSGGSSVTLPITVTAVTSSNPLKSFTASATCGAYKEVLPVPTSRSVSTTCTWSLNSSQTGYTPSSCTCH